MVLSEAGITIGRAFDALSDQQRAAIEIEARATYRAKYGKPLTPTNEKYLRERYALLQQRAQ